MDQRTSTNIKAFNWLCLRILNKLFEEFPRPFNFSATGFIIDQVTQQNFKQGDAEHLNYLTESIEWLSHEGIIRFERAEDVDYIGVILTSKGLSALGYKFHRHDALLRKQTLIVKIRDAIEKQAIERASELMGLLLKLVLS